VSTRVYTEINILEGDYDYTIEIHADMLFPKVWLTPILHEMSKNPDVAIGMPYILNNPNILLNINELEELVIKHRGDTIQENVRQVHPWVLNNSIVRKIGYYDSIFSPRFCEDDDFIFNVMKNGYKTFATKESIVLHYGSKTQSFAILPDNLAYNFNLFKEKHGITVEELVQKFTLHPVICQY